MIVLISPKKSQNPNPNATSHYSQQLTALGSGYKPMSAKNHPVVSDYQSDLVAYVFILFISVNFDIIMKLVLIAFN